MVEKSKPSALPNYLISSELVARARSRWPRIHLPESEVTQFFASRLTRTSTQDEVENLCWSELYLACGVLRNNCEALQTFEQEYVSKLAPMLRAIKARTMSPLISDADLIQSLREKVIVGDAACGPRLAEYRGRGNLQSWLRIVLARLVVDGCRAAPAFATDSNSTQFLEQALADQDLELGFLRKHHSRHFLQAFYSAAKRLSAREKNVLDLHFQHRLGLEEIARMYQVHRVSVSRWIAAAKATLYQETRLALAKELKLSHGGVDSLVRLVLSKLDVELSHVLR